MKKENVIKVMTYCLGKTLFPFDMLLMLQLVTFGLCNVETI